MGALAIQQDIIKPDQWMTERENMKQMAWRINNLYWIKDKDGKKVKFKLNWAQEIMFANLWFNMLVLKCRQLGFTTLIDIIALDSTLFNDNYRAGIITYNRHILKKTFREKVKFPFDNLPEGLKEEKREKGTISTQTEMTFSNGSSIYVDLTSRGDTLQFLHVSEFGKICARSPDKAQEIVTGAIESVGQRNIVIFESTAEGAFGYFYDYSMEALDLAKAIHKGEKEGLGDMDYKLCFFPWWAEPTYITNPKFVTLTKDNHEYFKTIENQINLDRGFYESFGLKVPERFTEEQKCWYAAKEKKQRDKMKREYPSTPHEAFEQSVEGAYYSSEMAEVREQKRITTVPFNPSYPVNVFFDIGVDDYTAIWFHQQIGLRNHFIDYMEGGDRGFSYYFKEMQKKPYIYGEWYMPHDVKVREWGAGDYATPRIEVVENLIKKNVNIVETPPGSLGDGIQMVRDVLPSCYFDEEKCKTGVVHLANFRKKFDKRLQVYLETEEKNEASHGAASFRMFAQGYRAPSIKRQSKKRKSWKTS